MPRDVCFTRIGWRRGRVGLHSVSPRGQRPQGRNEAQSKSGVTCPRRVGGPQRGRRDSALVGAWEGFLLTSLHHAFRLGVAWLGR
jgi:hypothetical protein